MSPVTVLGWLVAGVLPPPPPPPHPAKAAAAHAIRHADMWSRFIRERSFPKNGYLE
jgi:hypothetical protein